MSPKDPHACDMHLFDLFCAVKPLPDQRADWIQWLEELHQALGLVFRIAAKTFGRIEIAQARQVVELLYNDRRGSTPWGSNTPAHDLRDSPMLLASSVRSLEVIARACDAARGLFDAGEKAVPAFLAGLTQAFGEQIIPAARASRDVPTNAVLGLARCLVEQLEDLQGLVTVDSLETPHVARALEHALALERRLKQNTFEAGGYPTNDLFAALRELPESQRDALRHFGGISAQLISKLQAFWCSE